MIVILVLLMINTTRDKKSELPAPKELVATSVVASKKFAAPAPSAAVSTNSAPEVAAETERQLNMFGLTARDPHPITVR